MCTNYLTFYHLFPNNTKTISISQESTLQKKLPSVSRFLTIYVGNTLFNLPRPLDDVGAGRAAAAAQPPTNVFGGQDEKTVGWLLGFGGFGAVMCERMRGERGRRRAECLRLSSHDFVNQMLAALINDYMGIFSKIC